MTIEEFKTHKAQMDEARREFNQYWNTVLLPLFHAEDNSWLNCVVIERFCWTTFKHAKGLA